MTYLAAIQRLLWTLSSGAAAFALYRAFRLRLYRRFPVFTIYLAIVVVQYVSLVWISVGSEAYRTAWICFEPLIGIGLAAIAVESYLRLARMMVVDRQMWTLIGTGLMALGVIVSLLSAQFDQTWWDAALQFAIYSR